MVRKAAASRQDPLPPLSKSILLHESREVCLACVRCTKTRSSDASQHATTERTTASLKVMPEAVWASKSPRRDPIDSDLAAPGVSGVRVSGSWRLRGRGLYGLDLINSDRAVLRI